MENRRISVTRSFVDYLVNYTDNYFYATRYNDKDELKVHNKKVSEM